MTGRTLSHYQILDPLGSGGMGEVYKARDTRLNRFVAIKVLKSDLLSNLSRKQRFVQEAQSASALNHPNIVTIHDIFQHDGTDCLVMEYIAGKTLDALIPRNGFRLNEALKIAIQIAEGLRKAHAAGIIHRDIKPSNIIVPDDGPVKILDFGLAKLTESTEAGGDNTTRTSRPETEEGTVMGTVAYMSPEQAEGKKVDVRTDIFSFGTLFYEMLTGRRAFAGDSKLSTLSAILKDEPKPLENIPTDLDKIIRRCLRKDPAKRFQHMDDVKIILEEVREDSESGKLETPRPSLTAKSNTPYIAAALALAIAAGGFLYWRSTQTPPVPTGYTLKQITADPGLSTTPAISPDGRLIAFASDRQSDGNLDIWVQPLTAGARPIRLTTHAADDQFPSFSPDSSTIVFNSKRDGGGLYLVPALGGEERLLVKGKAYYDSAPCFSPDGKWIAYSSLALSESHLYVVSASGGELRKLAPNLAYASPPVWSPDSQHLIALGSDHLESPSEFWVIPANGAPAIPTGTRENSNRDRMNWTPGAIVFNKRGATWSVPIADGSWKMGTPRKLFDSTAGLRYAQAIGSGSGSPAQIVFAGETSARHLWSLNLDSNSGVVKGDPQPVPHPGGNQTQPALNADGRFLVYSQANPGREELRLLDVAAGKDTVLASGYARAKLSPDGTRVAYANDDGLFTIDTTGGGLTRILGPRPASNIYGWHPMGITYWYGSPIRFSLLDPATKQLRDLISHPTLSIHGAELSPDGKWLSFHIPGSAREPLYIVPMRDGKAGPQSDWILISDSAGFNRRPWWSANGNLLYSISERDGPVGIWAQRLTPDKHPKGAPFPIIRFPQTRRVPNALGAANFGPGVAPDHIVFALQEKSGNIWLAEANK